MAKKEFLTGKKLAYENAIDIIITNNILNSLFNFILISSIFI